MNDSPIKRLAAIDVIKKIIQHLPNEGRMMACRIELQEIVDGIFLELPEQRMGYLIRAGQILNRYAPAKDADQNSVQNYWFKIRDVMKEAFEGEKQT